MNNKKKHGFGLGISIYILVLLALIPLLWLLQWKYLAAYEANSMEYAVEDYMQGSFPQALQHAVEEYSTEHATKCQSAEQISSALKLRLKEEQWSYTMQDHDEDDADFSLCYDGQELGKLYLHAVHTNIPGLVEWNYELLPLEFDKLGRTISIVAPHGCTIVADGVDLPEDAISTTLGTYPQIEAYQQLIASPDQLLCYELNPVFRDLPLTVSNGFRIYPYDVPDAYYVLPECPAELGELLVDTAKQFSAGCLNFYGNQGGVWAAQQYVKPGTALYAEITKQQTAETLAQRQDAELLKAETGEFTYYGNIATCLVKYEQITAEGNRSGSLLVVMTDTEEGWKVVHLEEK